MKHDEGICFTLDRTYPSMMKTQLKNGKKNRIQNPKSTGGPEYQGEEDDTYPVFCFFCLGSWPRAIGQS